MSENGKVIVKVDAPVVGKMLGVQVLKDIQDSKELAKKDEPAVTVKPL
jgi:hypothetical protein